MTDAVSSLMEHDPLKPCPFCGKSPSWMQWSTAGSVGAYLCTTLACPANGRTETAYSPSAAAQRWNSRALQAATTPSDPTALAKAWHDAKGRHYDWNDPFPCRQCASDAEIMQEGGIGLLHGPASSGAPGGTICDDCDGTGEARNGVTCPTCMGRGETTATPLRSDPLP